MFDVNEFHVKFRHDYDLDPITGWPYLELFLIGDSSREGYMRTVCEIYVDGNLFVEGNVILDEVDWLRNGRKLNKLEGRRRALAKALRRSVFTREERTQFWEAFEARLQQDREKNVLPQLERDIKTLVAEFIRIAMRQSDFEPRTR